MADALSYLNMVQELLEHPDNHEQSDNQTLSTVCSQRKGCRLPQDLPLTFKEIAKRQQEDDELQGLRHKPSYAQTLYPFGDKAGLQVDHQGQ